MCPHKWIFNEVHCLARLQNLERSGRHVVAVVVVVVVVLHRGGYVASFVPGVCGTPDCVLCFLDLCLNAATPLTCSSYLLDVSTALVILLEPHYLNCHVHYINTLLR